MTAGGSTSHRQRSGFTTAGELSWTRDPFDRLLAAHARLRNWKLATADDLLLNRLRQSEVFPL